MTIRVAHIGTGNVGRCALAGILADPQFEPAAVWASSDAKAHVDAAELAGVRRIVNAIPAVVAAAAGIRTTLDLPLITGRRLYAPTTDELDIRALLATDAEGAF